MKTTTPPPIPQPAATHPAVRPGDRAPRAATTTTTGGFTLVEMLIVVGIIAMIILIAVPAFKALTGGRSIDAGANVLSAVLGQARAEAIGLRRATGVLFYLDPATDRVNALMVRQIPTPATALRGEAVYLDRVADRDAITMPVGVGVQTLESAPLTAATTTTPAQRRDDGYVGLNLVYLDDGSNTLKVRGSTVEARCGNAILFDAAGRLLTRPIRLHLRGPGNVPSELAKVLQVDDAANPGADEGTIWRDGVIESAIGFVLYDLDDFRTGAVVGDVASGGASGATDGEDLAAPSAAGFATAVEGQEEAWLDANAIPFVVSRFSGALLRNR